MQYNTAHTPTHTYVIWVIAEVTDDLTQKFDAVRREETETLKYMTQS